MEVDTKRSTKSAPVSLSTSYLIGSECIGISMITLKSLARSRPLPTRSRLIPTFLRNRHSRGKFGKLGEDLEGYYPSSEMTHAARTRHGVDDRMTRSLPLILTLDQHGVPHRWVTWQQAVWYYAKERVAWELGRQAFTIYGGRCHRTGERSKITANSIIAIRGKALAIKGFNQVPPLNNRELFNRDRFMCGFCGGDFSPYKLTCDHIL